MTASLADRIKLFKTVRDIPYSIGLSFGDPDYCCATKTPMLQKLLWAVGLSSRRRCCRFEWAGFGLPPEILDLAPSPDAGHEYLEVHIPETSAWVEVDAAWDRDLKLTGLPIAEWDGIGPTSLGVKASRTFSVIESEAIIRSIENTPPDDWRAFFEINRPFLRAINRWMEQSRSLMRVYAEAH